MASILKIKLELTSPSFILLLKVRCIKSKCFNGLIKAIIFLIFHCYFHLLSFILNVFLYDCMYWLCRAWCMVLCISLWSCVCIHVMLSFMSLHMYRNLCRLMFHLCVYWCIDLCCLQVCSDSCISLWICVCMHKKAGDT